MFELDPVLLARIQFAFTISFHIVFPAFTIGLASWLAVVEWRWLKTGNNIYKEVYLLWSKIFAVCFGMGVVSGIVLSYQLGTNWSFFSDQVGNVLGPLLGYEVLTAFFLEASFLGIMLFGWKRVSKRMHFVATCVVAGGTVMSAFWILAANSWMQTPSGYEIGLNGMIYPTSWLEIIFNPSFPYMFTHMVTAAYLVTSFVVAGVSSYYLWKNIHIKHAKIMFGMSMIMAIFVAPLQLVIGDLQGLNTLEHQPAKIAAMEGLWQTKKGADSILFAIPDQESQSNSYELKIEGLTSLLLTHEWDGEVKGLNEWSIEDQPPVGIVFWSFRVMVGIGLLMILTGIFALYLYFRKRLFTTRWFQLWCMAMTPSGFIALLAGWFITEVGRQPYTIYGVLRTDASASPVIPEQIAITLIAFIVIYTVLFGAGSFYILKLIGKGPKTSSNTNLKESESMLTQKG